MSDHFSNGAQEYLTLETGSYAIFQEEVKVLQVVPVNDTLFHHKVQHSFGSMFGKKANDYSKAIMTAFERKVAMAKAANAAMAKTYPGETSFQEETNSWFPNLQHVNGIGAKILRQLSLFGLVTFYSFLTCLIMLWIFSIITKAIVFGIASRETWETILSIFYALYEFGYFFFKLFRLVGHNQHLAVATAPPPPYYEEEK